MSGNEDGSDNDQAMTDVSLESEPRNSLEILMADYHHRIFDWAGIGLLVGTYKAGPGWEKFSHADVTLTVNQKGRVVYKVDGHDVDEPDVPKVKPEDIDWFEVFNIKDERKRGNKIFDVIHYKAITEGWDQDSDKHIISDPVQRAEYERREKVFKERKYWVPTFKEMRWCPGYEEAYYKSFVNGTFNVMHEMQHKLKKLAGDRVESEEPEECRKVTLELFLAVSRQIDLFQHWVDINRVLWTETVRMTADENLPS